MALLAVDALLLSTSSCRVAATMSRESSGPAGRVVALGRSIVTLPSRRLVAGDAATPRVQAKLLGRRRDNDSASDASGEEVRGSARSRIRSFATRRAGPTVHDARVTSKIDAVDPNNCNNSSNSNSATCRWRHAQRLLPMWVDTRRERAKPSAKREFVRIVSCAREALGWAGNGDGDTLGQGRLGTTRQSRKGGETSSEGGHETQQRKRTHRRQRQQQQDALVSTGASPAVETSPKAVASISSTDATAAAAAAGGADAGTVRAPIPSYLRWTNRGASDSISPGEQEGGSRRPSKKGKVLSLGKENRGENSGQEAAASGGGSLGTAKSSRGGAATVSLTFGEAMFAGAVSRSIAQTCMQPANVVKTLLQGRGTSKQLSNLSFKLLTRGAGAQFVMSLPHGAFNFATLEVCTGSAAVVLYLNCTV